MAMDFNVIRFYFVKIIIVLSLFLISACDNYVKEVGVDIDYLYANALGRLKENDLSGSKKYFLQIVDEYPYKDEAIEAQVFLIWIYYLNDDYVEAEVAIDAFLKYYVSNKYTKWAQYMQALINYDQMKNPYRDQNYAKKALYEFTDIYKRSDDSVMVRDAEYRIQIIMHNLALRNMNIAMYYLKNKEYLAALARYQDVVNNYQDTAFIQEALYRLAYVWMVLGVDQEAFKVVAVLGYNYSDNIWYDKALDLLKKYSDIDNLDQYMIQTNQVSDKQFNNLAN